MHVESKFLLKIWKNRWLAYLYSLVDEMMKSTIIKKEIKTIVTCELNSLQLKDKGVHVRASTLGSLEGVPRHLKVFHIPVE